MKKTVLVTGCAGFIGYHLTNRLLKKKYTVVGIDNINNYYSTKLKKDRVKQIKINDKNKKFHFYRCNLKNFNKQKKLFKKYKPTYVINLAAQAGVRYSIENPMAYVDSNLVGFTNILELCRYFHVKHLLYASTSSVYGASKKHPYNENDIASHPVAFYGATKRANELMAHSYSYLYKLPTTGLRFFTVYGPWGRPDMALFKFVQNIIKKKSINVFNRGKHTRDFTYVDDIVESIILLINKVPKAKRNFLFNDPSESSAPYRILNIGNNKPVKLMEYIKEIEVQLKIKANIKFLPMQKGDIETTFASKKKLVKITGYTPKTSISIGISKFIKWFLGYYKISHVK
jgi:UDP-glucuronate 4-epimerase